MDSDDSVKYYPTANFGDSFGIFNHLLSYQKSFKKFKIHFYVESTFDNRVSCDFSVLVELLSSLEYERYSDVVVFGYPTEEPLNVEVLFAIYHDSLTGNRCIRFYH